MTLEETSPAVCTQSWIWQRKQLWQHYRKQLGRLQWIQHIRLLTRRLSPFLPRLCRFLFAPWHLMKTSCPQPLIPLPTKTSELLLRRARKCPAHAPLSSSKNNRPSYCEGSEKVWNLAFGLPAVSSWSRCALRTVLLPLKSSVQSIRHQFITPLHSFTF